MFSLSQFLGILCTTIIWLSWDLLENLLKQISTGKSHSPHWHIFKCSTAQTYEVVLPHPMSCPFLLRIFTDEVGYYLWVSYKVCLLAQYPSCVEHPHLVVAPPSLVLQFPMSIQIVFLFLISFPRSWRNLFMPSQSDSLYPESCSGFVSLALLQSTRWGLC